MKIIEYIAPEKPLLIKVKINGEFHSISSSSIVEIIRFDNSLNVNINSQCVFIGEFESSDEIIRFNRLTECFKDFETLSQEDSSVLKFKYVNVTKTMLENFGSGICPSIIEGCCYVGGHRTQIAFSIIASEDCNKRNFNLDKMLKFFMQSLE